MEELINKILAFDHNAYYVDTFHTNHNEFEVGKDGFLSDDQLSEIQDSSELYEIIRLAHRLVRDRENINEKINEDDIYMDKKSGRA